MREPIFPSLAAAWMSRQHLENHERALMVERLIFGNTKDWEALDQVDLPPLLLPSADPVVLALRRFVARNPAPIGARHRLAMENAHQRPLGFVRLMLEEAWCLKASRGGRVEEERSQAIEITATLAKPLSAIEPAREIADFQALVLLARARQLTRGLASDWQRPWYQALDIAKLGSGDLELDVTALEIAARGAAVHDTFKDRATADGWWRLALGLLAEAPHAVPDRVAEIGVGYATFLADRGRRREAAGRLKAAEKALAQVDARWNAPLRARIAALRERLPAPPSRKKS
jgi:hypothetical protein